jgi:hypothetical protein
MEKRDGPDPPYPLSSLFIRDPAVPIGLQSDFHPPFKKRTKNGWKKR